jgi:choline dehydrogenase-like flavoprotein
MFIDARGIATGTLIDTDVCIVGAGAAGITIAREFSGSGVAVCLVESGDLQFHWSTQSLYEGRNLGLPYFGLNVCQLRYFGGNTNAWGGWCRPLDPIDFEHRPWVKHSGWPFGAGELEPYYRVAHQRCQVESPDYDPQAWMARLADPRARLLPFDPTRLEPTVYHFSPPTRFGQVYRDVIGRSENIRCLLNANVLKIRTTGDARSVTHIDVGTLCGNRLRVAAKLFVLAAGGIENTRLLLLSNDVISNGLGNQHDLVGRFFMEHPHVKRALVVPRRTAPLAPYGLRFHDRGVSLRLALPPEFQEREALLQYSANIHPVYIGHDSDGWLSFRKLVLSLSPSRRGDPYVRFPPYGRKGLSVRQVWDIAREFDKVTIAAVLQLLQPHRLISGYILESKGEQAPNAESRITLQRVRDPFGLNRVQVDWRMLPEDRRTTVRGEEIIGEELARLGIGALLPLPPSEEEEAWPDNLEGGWHQIGTTRMHDDPRQGVVDRDGLVHGMSNLFVAGSSVFPTGGVAPPTLTIVALALRLASHLKATLAGEHIEVTIKPARIPARRESEPVAVAQLPARPLASPSLPPAEVATAQRPVPRFRWHKAAWFGASRLKGPQGGSPSPAG